MNGINRKFKSGVYISFNSESDPKRIAGINGIRYTLLGLDIKHATAIDISDELKLCGAINRIGHRLKK